MSETIIKEMFNVSCEKNIHALLLSSSAIRCANNSCCTKIQFNDFESSLHSS